MGDIQVIMTLGEDLPREFQSIIGNSNSSVNMGSYKEVTNAGFIRQLRNPEFGNDDRIIGMHAHVTKDINMQQQMPHFTELLSFRNFDTVSSKTSGMVFGHLHYNCSMARYNM